MAIAGSFGLGHGKRSFMEQIKLLANGRFSYCLVPMANPKPSTLRFGADMLNPSNLTPIIRDPDPSRYLVELLDISINRRWLNLPPGTFARHPYGSGGCYFDIGVGPTYLVDPAYQEVTSAIDQYLQRYLVRVPYPSPLQLEFCYRKRPGFMAFPAVTFHFRGGNLSPKSENLFQFVDDPLVGCLFVKRAPLTLIGAVAQQDYKVVFDLNIGRVFWEKRDCTGF